MNGNGENTHTFSFYFRISLGMFAYLSFTRQFFSSSVPMLSSMRGRNASAPFWKHRPL